MKRLIATIVFVFTLYTNAQIPPILDHTWTIEQIDTGTQIIQADLNSSGEYDSFILTLSGILDGKEFYNFLFGNCFGYFSFYDSNSTLLNHHQGCILSDDSTQIALYFNDYFIQQNTNTTMIDNDFFPNAYGPLNYSFTTAGNIIYLHITNTIGEVATFSANNLSTDTFLEQAISIYPNPVIDVLHVDSSILAIKSLKIYDLNGRLVKEPTLNQEQQMSLSDLQADIYLIEVETSVGRLIKKIVKN